MVKNKAGRPSDYKKEYCDLAFKFALLGATDKQMANFFDVSESTLNLWKKSHQKFSESLKEGKLKADANIAHSLYNRGLGYSHEEEVIFQFKGEIIRANTIRHYPPDTAAAFIWLKNRAGWRDNKDEQQADDRLEDNFEFVGVPTKEDNGRFKRFMN